MASVRALDRDLIRIFQYCHRTWRDGSVVLEYELIELAAAWSKLGLPEPCPFAIPEQKEWTEHKRKFFYLESVMKIRSTITDYLDVPSDGWVPTDLYIKKQKAHLDAFETLKKGLEDTVDEAELDEWPFTVDDLIMLWPFDLAVARRVVDEYETGSGRSK